MKNSEPKYLDDGQQYKSAYARALRLLTARGRSKWELFSRLSDRSYQYKTEIVKDIIEEMEQCGYLDDRKFAAEFVSQKAETQLWGRRRVEFELKKLRVDEGHIEEAYAELQIDEAANARAALKSRYPGGFEDAAEKRRAFLYLARLGYDAGVCGEAFEGDVE